MKYPVHKSILFYTLCSNNSQPQSAITTRFFDGVEEFENVGGAFDIDAYKHTIFITLIFFKKHGGGTYIYVYLQEKVMKYAIIINGEEQPLKFFANNINELFEFLLDYDIDFDTVKLVSAIPDLNNFSLN